MLGINRSLSITVLTLIRRSATWYVRVSWTCCCCCKQIWSSLLPLENRVWVSTPVLPSWHTDTVLTLFKFYTTALHGFWKLENKICLSGQTFWRPNRTSHLTLLPGNNRVQCKAALFAGLQTAYSPQGHYPAQEMRKWAPDVTGKPLAQNAGLNWEGEGRAMLDQSSDMFTLQLRIFLRARPSCRSSQAPE